MSLDTLHARVEAAPHGARVAVKGGAELSRETILKALDTPPSAPFEALEVCTLPDDEWRAGEPLALETIEATNAGAPTYEADLTTRKHVRFLQADRRRQRFLSAHPPRHGRWGTLVALPGASCG